MAYATSTNILNRLSEHGASAYLDGDGDGILNSAELQLVTDAIAIADAVIDARLAACGRKVATVGKIIQRISVALTTLEVCTRKGQQPAWAIYDAKHWSAILDQICENKLLPGSEVGTLTGRMRGPRASNPRVSVDDGITWPHDKKTLPEDS